MALYAIGDIQGCYQSLNELLGVIHFEPAADRLWFTGDLVNRGPESLATLRFVRDLADRAVTVLGNHDLHLLAIAWGGRKQARGDTLDAVLKAPDRDELLAWLRNRPLAVDDPELGVFMVHAGLLPQWSLQDAMSCAEELENTLRSDAAPRYFETMSGNTPNIWDKRLTGWPRLRLITNALTRLRYCDTRGGMRFSEKGPPVRGRERGFRPWFELREHREDERLIVFGHWSSLGAINNRRVIGLDSGCVWGGQLTAVRLHPDPRVYYRVQCPDRRGAVRMIEYSGS